MPNGLIFIMLPASAPVFMPANPLVTEESLMKPFVRYTAVILAVGFLCGGCIACIDLIERGATISDPLWRTAAGLLSTGTIFLFSSCEDFGFGVSRFTSRPKRPHGIRFSGVVSAPFGN